jgi:UDP-N-acetylmuramate: L-alanyl-gamma-D-glutamyl-meso-diaminopimelate ligase
MDLSSQLDSQTLTEYVPRVKKVFFYRICGTGMGAAATILAEKGFEVEGGDLRFEPPMSDYLSRMNIPLHELSIVDAKMLQKFDLIVVGNVVPRESEDAKLIESAGVPFCSFPTALGAMVLKHKNVVGIAGTHGKTTTTYLATQIFENLGHHPGYFIGGVIDARPSSRLGDDSYFFIESDEYDSCYFEKFSKFRSYELDHMILTSLEFDHGDIFNSLEDIQNQFSPVLKKLTGHLIYDDSYMGSKELLTKSGVAGHGYGLHHDRGPLIVEEGHKGTSFELVYGGERRLFKTNLIGHHNILNLCACLIFADLEGIAFEAIEKAILNLSLVKRRQEIRGKLGKALVIDDFAHHPRAVELTLKGLKTRFPNKLMTVVFEPHSATARSDLFQNEFVEAFRQTSRLIITKPSRPTSLKIAGNLNLDVMKNELQETTQTTIVNDLSELCQALETRKGEDDLIVILSNGTCLGFWESGLVVSH